jgi:hypothetical protein
VTRTPSTLNAFLVLVAAFAVTRLPHVLHRHEERSERLHLSPRNSLRLLTADEAVAWLAEAA